MKNIKQLKLKPWVKRTLIIISILLALSVIALFGTKIYLYINFILGNDIIVRIEASESYLELTKGESVEVNFKASITTNPFCTAFCKSSFEDINQNKTIDNEEFTLKPGIPSSWSYTVKNDEFGESIRLYRFNLECRSNPTKFCNTKGELTSRSNLIVVENVLNNDEKLIKSNLTEKLKNLKDRLEILNGEISNLKSFIYEINEFMFVGEEINTINKLNNNISENIAELKELEILWGTKDYILINNRYEKLNIHTSELEEYIYILKQNFSDMVHSYNLAVEDINIARLYLENLSSFEFNDPLLLKSINESIDLFNLDFSLFKKKIGLYEKKAIAELMRRESFDSYSNILSKIDEQILKISLETDIHHSILCKLNQTCIKNIGYLDIGSVCEERNHLLNIYSSLNISEVNESEDSINLTYEFNNLIEELKEDYSSEESITILERLTISEDIISNSSNITSELIKKLIEKQPEQCIIINKTFLLLNKTIIDTINIGEPYPIRMNVNFKDHLPVCCFFGDCEDCCTEDCSSNYPIIFLHGHAFNKDTEAEYSLDAFTKIQSRLEHDGYLDAGSVSLYTKKEGREGILGLINSPVTIKVSYYFDIFQEPENYIIVQAKSENIDTYAIRLKDILDIVEYKTGKPKVTIIAHSMGGLVARRYIQIFGNSKIDKLIMIGTPNKGIEGSIADYCGLIGEKNECKDMNSKSLFINKINRNKDLGVKVYNIVGVGCQMKGRTGDGVVLKNNVEMDSAVNLFVNGTCKGRNILHTDMLDIDTYPIVYDLILNTLI